MTNLLTKYVRETEKIQVSVISILGMPILFIHQIATQVVLANQGLEDGTKWVKKQSEKRAK